MKEQEIDFTQTPKWSAHKRAHRQHYIKYQLYGNISIRYYITFEDRPEFEKSWFIKNHETNDYTKVTEKFAKDLIIDTQKEQKRIIQQEEIVGKAMTKSKYYRVDLMKPNDIFEDDRIKEFRKEIQ